MKNEIRMTVIDLIALSMPHVCFPEQVLRIDDPDQDVTDLSLQCAPSEMQLEVFFSDGFVFLFDIRDSNVISREMIEGGRYA